MDVKFISEHVKTSKDSVMKLEEPETIIQTLPVVRSIVTIVTKKHTSIPRVPKNNLCAKWP